MSLNVAESHAVNVLMDYLLQEPNSNGVTPTSAEAKEAAALLSDAAYKRFNAGVRRIDVEGAWDDSPAARVAPVDGGRPVDAEFDTRSGSAAVVMRDGELVCPHCDAAGIVEVDQAVRYNRLRVEGGAVFASTGQGDFETDHYECGTCGRDVELPFEIEDWS